MLLRITVIFLLVPISIFSMEENAIGDSTLKRLCQEQRNLDIMIKAIKCNLSFPLKKHQCTTLTVIFDQARAIKKDFSEYAAHRDISLDCLITYQIKPALQNNKEIPLSCKSILDKEEQFRAQAYKYLIKEMSVLLKPLFRTLFKVLTKDFPQITEGFKEIGHDLTWWSEHERHNLAALLKINVYRI